MYSRVSVSQSAVLQDKIHANHYLFSEKLALSISLEKHLKGNDRVLSGKRPEYGELKNIRGLNRFSLIPDILIRSVKSGECSSLKI